MKLSEVKNERIFNLEISESDLQLILGNLIFYPQYNDHESRQPSSEEAIGRFSGACEDVGVDYDLRSTYIVE